MPFRYAAHVNRAENLAFPVVSYLKQLKTYKLCTVSIKLVI